MKAISWQKLLLFAALALLAVGLTACGGRAQAAPVAQDVATPEADDATTAEEPAEPAEEAAAAEAPAAEAPAAEAPAVEEKEPVSSVAYRTYVSVMPAASGGGTRIMTLRFYEDGTLAWVTHFDNDEAPIEEVGSWTDNGDGTLTATVTGQVDSPYDEANEIVFQIGEGEIVAVEYDESMYGSEGLQLESVLDIAAGIEASLFTLDLAAGFPLDPTFMSVNAGGAIPADLLGTGCTGFVNAKPVVTLNWSGQSDFLKAFFVSDDDPTLVILTPDGQALCNDDANDQLLDPVVEIANPVEGAYRIWAGSYNEGNLLPGVLVLTTKKEVNLGTFNLGAFIERAQIPEVAPEPETIASAEALIETLKMAVAESPDLTEADLPTEMDVVADGIVPLFQLPLENKGCSGLVSGAPSYTFNWTGAADAIRVMFEGDGDSSLLIIGPDMSVACADDSADGANQNPVIDISQPMAGLHAVYVGRLNPETPVTGVLSITDQSDEPAVLAPASE